MKRSIQFIFFILLMISTGICFAEDTNITLWQDMNGKRIGVMTGSVGGPALEQNLPKAAIFYFNSITDLLPAMQTGKVDGICCDDSLAKYMKTEVNNLNILDGYLLTAEYAPIFQKNEKGQALADQYSDFVKKLWADGTIEEIDAIWFGNDEKSKTVLDYENLPDINGTLHMAADLSVVPFVMMLNNRIVGYDVDIAARFCEAYGYRLQIEPMTFSSIIPAVVSGKCDFSASNFTITPERAESVIFSEPVYRGGMVISVLGDNAETSSGSVSASGTDGKSSGDPEYSEFGQLSGRTFRR